MNGRWEMVSLSLEKLGSPEGSILLKSWELDRAFFLQKSKENRVRALPLYESSFHVFKNSWRNYYDKWEVELLLELCSRVVRALPFYILEFQPTEDIWNYIEGINDYGY